MMAAVISSHVQDFAGEREAAGMGRFPYILVYLLYLETGSQPPLQS